MKNVFTFNKARTISVYLKALPLIALFFFAAKISTAQKATVTFNLLKAPCNNDGILVAHVTGATPPLTFSWYGAKSVTYIVNDTIDTLYNYNGSMAYVSVYNNSTQAYGQYAGQPPFTYRIITTPAICPLPGTAKAVITGGTAPYIVQWYTSGTNNNVAATGDSVTLKGGNYSILITDAHGCSFGSGGGYTSGTNQYDSIRIEYRSSVSFSITPVTANCTNGAVNLSNVTGGAAPYNYQWSTGANTPSITGLVTGTYGVTITDALGCTTGNSYINVPQSVRITANATATNATCLQNDGSAIAFGSGGVSPYTYMWTNGQQTPSISGLTAGSYTVNVTDSKGCIGSGYAYITSTTPITVTYTATPSSCTAATGSATLNITGGTTPYVVKWNTFPAQATVTATNLAPGTYSFAVTDAVGCVRTGSPVVPPVSVIAASSYKADAVCTQANGTAGVQITAGTAPYTYQWSNGATSAAITGLTAGGYACTVTDSKSCRVYKYAAVGASSPISLSFSSTAASCIYANDGSITAQALGGTAPYNYSWSSGQTTATSTSLTQGIYYAYVSDAAGCVQSAHSYVTYDPTNNSCYCTVSGTVYNDLNNNCMRDGGEPGIQNIMMHLDGFGYTYTDANGNYSFLAPSGNYTLSEEVQSFYPLASCQSNSISIPVTASSGCTITNDIANVINPIHDISILTTSYCPPPIPGFTYMQRVVVQNRGTVTESNIHAAYDNKSQLSLNTFTPPLFTSQGNDYYNVISGFTSLAPGATQTFDISYNVPVNIPLGTSLVYNDTVAYDTIPNWVNDYSPWNNVNAYQNIVVGSFDPNEKEVTPVGIGLPGYIETSDSVLTYTIHFQNTGSYQAQRVVVIDTLDSHLDFTTLHPGYSNYNYSTAVSEGGVLKFTFDNINLPDSFTNKLGSVGMVTYDIHQKKDNLPGTEIKSPADIYFDYNAPVKTNTPLNTLAAITAEKKVAKKDFDLTVYPNPTSAGKINMVINTGVANAASTLDIYNLVGQSVQSKTINLNKGKNIVSTDVKDLPAGLYFVKVGEGKNSLVQKLTVIK